MSTESEKPEPATGRDRAGEPGDAREPDLDALEAAVGHRFADREVARVALTHASFANEVVGAPCRHNEALEFLGDAVLAFVVSDALYRRFPEFDEGALSQHRALLVQAPTLAEASRRLGIGAFLRLGRGERQAGGERNARILAGAFEALLAATYLDGGLPAATDLVLRALGERLAELDGRRRVADWKSALQEVVQARGLGPPSYRVVEESGRDHAKSFRVVVHVGDEDLGEGVGTTKRAAHQVAARQALEALQSCPPAAEEE